MEEENEIECNVCGNKYADSTKNKVIRKKIEELKAKCISYTTNNKCRNKSARRNIGRRKGMKNIDFFEFFTGLGLCILVVTPLLIEITDNSKQNESEQIKQLKQSLTEQIQECEVYRNRCLELEEMLEGTGLVVDNCECR